MSSGAGSWLSGVQALRAYQRSCLPRDVVAGSFMYAIVGPSRILVLGPDSSLAPLIAAAVLPLAAGRDAEAVALAGLLAIFSGLLCVLAGLARFGFIADLLSKPVRYGNMNGIALTVLLSMKRGGRSRPGLGEDVGGSQRGL